MNRQVASLCFIIWLSFAGLPSSLGVDRKAVQSEQRALPNQESSSSTDERARANPSSVEATNARTRESVSPYSIRQYVEEHKSDEYVSLEVFWEQLGIDVEEWKKYERCEAAIFELNLGSDEAASVMVRLYDHSGWSMGGTRYLLFKPVVTARKTEWKLLGHVDFEDQRYEVPQHRVIRSGTDHWIVFTVLAGRGSAFSLHQDQWYEIADDAIKLVLGYPSSKYLGWSDFIPMLNAGSKIISATTESERTTVVIELSVSFYLEDAGAAKEKTDLWVKKQRAVFVRFPDADGFVLDAKRSQVSSAELNVIYDGEGPTNSELLRYHFAELERLASSSNEIGKAWLLSFLDQCRHIPERERLLKALTQ